MASSSSNVPAAAGVSSDAGNVAGASTTVPTLSALMDLAVSTSADVTDLTLSIAATMAAHGISTVTVHGITVQTDEDTPATSSPPTIDLPMSDISTEGGFLTEFHPFPRLPIELRFTILNLAASDRKAREIELVTVPGAKETTFKSSHPTPALLHVNQESRNEISKLYLRIFTESVLPFFFDNELDTLRIPTVPIDAGFSFETHYSKTVNGEVIFEDATTKAAFGKLDLGYLKPINMVKRVSFKSGGNGTEDWKAGGYQMFKCIVQFPRMELMTIELQKSTDKIFYQWLYKMFYNRLYGWMVGPVTGDGNAVDVVYRGEVTRLKKEEPSD